MCHAPIPSSGQSMHSSTSSACLKGHATGLLEWSPRFGFRAAPLSPALNGATPRPQKCLSS